MKINDDEVDFVLKEGFQVKQLIQVTYASSRNNIEKREARALLKASEQLKCKNLLIITWDYEDEFKIDNRKIRCIPLWKWLLKL
ncbi:MAG: ATP-binding protein [Candidatus Brockarchaeota archaeon]|nr:ATP-binding protein [Candidatus Brockarchaeota archaeon]MBO3808797.1 ATP-binding protein [Candidatus Brockarchaeota archaeon]